MRDESAPAQTPDRSISASIERLVESGRQAVASELEWARLKGGLIALSLRNVVLLATFAVVFLLAGLTTFFIGTILMLSPFLGPVLATFAVALSALLIAFVLALLARRAARNIVGSSARTNGSAQP